MQYITENYKLFGFIALFKSVRANSMLYSHERIYSFITSQGIKISSTTFKTYMKKATEKGYIMNMGKHIQIKNLDFIGRDLGMPFETTKKIGKYVYNIKRDYKKGIKAFNKDKSYKDMVNSILKLAEFFKFSDQQSKIDSKSEFFQVWNDLANDKTHTGASYSLVKKVKKEASKAGMDVKPYSKRMLANYDGTIKFGNRHFSEALGISPDKATKIMKSLVADGYIYKSVQIKNHGVVSSHADFDMLMDSITYLKKDAKAKGFVYLKRSSNELIEVQGTKIVPRDYFSSLSSSLSVYISKEPQTGYVCG